MSWLRSPYFWLLSSLGMAAFFYVSYVQWWMGMAHPPARWSLSNVLLYATTAAAVPLLVALISFVAVAFRRGQRFSTPVSVVLGLVLIAGTLYGLALSWSMG
jgi:hypothetical protein